MNYFILLTIPCPYELIVPKYQKECKMYVPQVLKWGHSFDESLCGCQIIPGYQGPLWGSWSQ